MQGYKEYNAVQGVISLAVRWDYSLAVRPRRTLGNRPCPTLAQWLTPYAGQWLTPYAGQSPMPYSGRSLRFIRRVVRHRLVTISPLSKPAKVPSRNCSGKQARKASLALSPSISLPPTFPKATLGQKDSPRIITHPQITPHHMLQ